MDWFDLLAVQGALKSLLQHHISKAAILLCSAFFIVQLSHPYMTTGETIPLTRRAFVSKVISLHFNMLSRLVIAFLPRSKHLLISWLQSLSEVILEPLKIKPVTVSLSICHDVMGLETVETVADFIFGGSKITANGDCCHEIKRRLLLGRKVMTNLDSILKTRDITLLTKVHLVKAVVFPAVMCGCRSWTIKKAECQRIDAFELWCWRRL